MPRHDTTTKKVTQIIMETATPAAMPAMVPGSRGRWRLGLEGTSGVVVTVVTSVVGAAVVTLVRLVVLFVAKPPAAIMTTTHASVHILQRVITSDWFSLNSSYRSTGIEN